MRPSQYRRHKAGIVKTRLSFLARASMIADRLAGKRTKQIAEKYGVERTTVWRVLRLIPASILIAICAIGCTSTPLGNVRALPSPAIEQPVLQLPVPMRQKNWEKLVEGKKEGSCVYASLTTVSRWVHRPDIAAWLSDPTINGGGEHGQRLRARLDDVGIQYAYTDRASEAFLNSRRGCILWWKTSHCCTFAGWVRVDGKRYAAIIDNNHPNDYELTEDTIFIDWWNKYGGFGLTLLYDPASPRPWLSYTVN
jgi:hypothetical protein